MKQIVISTIFEQKVKEALEVLKKLEPEDGYWVSFSGGKDSQVVYHLCKEAGVKFQGFYCFTTIDPPELVQFIRENYPDVLWLRPEKNMWRLIIENGVPPTARYRYCCYYLKEKHAFQKGKVIVLGIRTQESPRRKRMWTSKVMYEKGGEYNEINSFEEYQRIISNSDVRVLINPILNWKDTDVWNYINSRKLKYCSLYDEGFERLGCVGCPLANLEQRLKQFERWRNFKKLYLIAFEKMLQERKRKGLPTTWGTAEEVMHWWLFER